MKICGISDIHGNLYNKIPKCDVLCICGDTIPLSIQRDPEQSARWWNVRFSRWVADLPCKKVLVVPGNHDFYLEKLYNSADWDVAKDFIRDMTDNKVELLIDELYEYEGIKFYGTPWIKPIQFQEGRWAFEYPTDETGNDPFEKIPKCDMLLSHDNPNNNDKLYYYTFGKYKHHLFGHWHDGIAYGHLNQYNCSILDDWYKFKKDLKIVTIDVMTETDKQQIEQAFLKKLIEEYKEREGVKDGDDLCIETMVVDVIDFLEEHIEEVLSEVKEDEIEWYNNITGTA